MLVLLEKEEKKMLKKLVKRSTSAEDKRETVITITQVGINILEISTVRINKLFDEAIIMDESSAAQLNNLLEEVRIQEK